jgi:hypothetical protein
MNVLSLLFFYPDSLRVLAVIIANRFIVGVRYKFLQTSSGSACVSPD